MKRPCLVCGTPSNNSRCATHTMPRHRETQRAYNKRGWRKASAYVRAMQPYCSRCGSEWDLTADHVVPLARGGEEVPSLDGIDVLCRRCNSAKKHGGVG